MAKKIRPVRGTPAESQRLRAHAQQLMILKRHDVAEEVLRQILAIEPNDPKVNRQLGTCLVMLRRLDEAFEQAKIAVSLDPLSEVGLSLLAAIHSDLGHHKEAAATYEQALASKADYVPAIAGLAHAMAVKAKWIPALEWTEKGLALKPDHVGMLRTRGEALAALKRKDEALAVMQQFLRLAPDDVRSQTIASAILRRLEETTEATEFAQRAMQMNPADPYLHNSLAQLKLKERNFEEAGRHFKEAAEIYDSRREGQKGPKEIEIKSLLGQAALNLRNRQLQLAEAQYRRILEINPEHSSASALLAAAIGAQYRFDEALPMARAAAEKWPKLLIPRLMFPAILSEMERHEEAIDEITVAFELNPNSAELHRLLAAVYIDLEDYVKAFEIVEKGLAIKEEPIIKRKLAVTLAGLGRREESISVIEAALREDPDYYVSQGLTGYTYYLLKDYERAESHYRRAMELDASGLGCHGKLGLVYFDQGRIAEARPLLEKSIALNPYQRRVRAALAEIASESGL
jgi:tetratricopeptide (TPR) repeat protein